MRIWRPGSVPSSDLESQQSAVPSQRITTPRRFGNAGLQPDILQIHKARNLVRGADELRKQDMKDGTRAYLEASGLADAPLPSGETTVPNRLRMVPWTQTFAGVVLEPILLIPANPSRRRFILSDPGLVGNASFSYGGNGLGFDGNIQIAQWDENGIGVSTDNIYVYVKGPITVIAYEGVDFES